MYLLLSGACCLVEWLSSVSYGACCPPVRWKSAIPSAGCSVNSTPKQDPCASMESAGLAEEHNRLVMPRGRLHSIRPEMQVDGWLCRWMSQQCGPSWPTPNLTMVTLLRPLPATCARATHPDMWMSLHAARRLPAMTSLSSTCSWSARRSRTTR